MILKKMITALAFLTLLPSILFSQTYWQKADIGNEGGIINVLYSDTITQTLYAGSDGKGIFSTTNAGASWRDLTSDLPSKALNVKSIVKAGNDLILGAFYFTQSEGIYRSTNGGANWSEITSSLTGDSRKIDKVFFENLKLYIGTQAGIFVTNYPAVSWVNITSNLSPSSQVTNIFSTDNLLFIKTESGVFKSSNSGLNWISANSGLPGESGESFLKNNSTLYTSVFGEGVYSSNDLGNSWTPFNTNLNSGGEYSRSLYRFNNNIYVSTNNGVYVLSGSSWIRVSNNLPASQNFCYSLGSAGGKLFTCSYNRGTYSSSDPAVTWSQSITGLRANYMYTHNAVLLNGVYYLATNSGIHISPNCVNWTRSNGDLPAPAYFVNQIYVFSGDLYITTENGLYRSSNSGVNWISMNGDISSTVKYYSFFKDASRIYAGTANGLFYSTNNAVNWLPTEVNVMNNPVDCITKSASGTLYAGRSVANTSTLFRSTNNGVNWTPLTFAQFGSPEVFSFFEDGGVFYATTGAGIFRTTNNGVNWKNCNHGLSLDPYITSMIKIGSSYFCGAKFGGGGLYRSNTVDSAWGEVNTRGNPFSDYNGLISVNNKIFVLLSTGIFYSDVSGLTGFTPVTVSAPASYLLLKNYPNPFNPLTKISYTIPASGNVKLEVYDVSGKLVKELLNSFRSQGNYETTFEGSSYNSGIYFLKLTTGNNTITNKLVLLK